MSQTIATKHLALDLGDAWVGVAVSDPLGMLARPLETIRAEDLFIRLPQLLQQERVSTVILGRPITCRGTESSQTEKIDALAAQLANLFPNTVWKCWDERLSSKRAQQVQTGQKKKITKETKQQSHAIAAAFILDSYLFFLQSQNAKNNEDE
jgi:putative Holliday junction resolvase